MKKPRLLDLRPTQFVLGMKEIESKVKKIGAFSEKELTRYCETHVIPVVLGPKREAYLIDHHHFARACWETGVQEYRVKVIEDLAHLNTQQFWNFMIRKEWTYLGDQFGMGPHDPLALPMDIRGLADDPYRSLAWAVREAGGFNKMEVPFFEFQWAAFYRKNLTTILHSKSDFKLAVKSAVFLSKSSDAKHLPGFRK